MNASYARELELARQCAAGDEQAWERFVLESRCGFHTGEVETLQTIGVAFGFTRECIRQIEKKALLQLRQRLTRE